MIALLLVAAASAVARAEPLPDGSASPPAEEAAPPAEIRAGIFLTDLYAFHFAENHFTAKFWAWFTHAREDFTPGKSVEIIGARGCRVLNAIREPAGDKGFWDTAQIEAVINQPWDIVHYPFDRQTIRLTLEIADQDIARSRFTADVQGSKVSPALQLAGWTVERTAIRQSDHRYPTAYGDPSMPPDGPSVYSRVQFEVEMKRHGWRLLFNDFIGFFFAILLASLVMVLNGTRGALERFSLRVKLGVGTGALFASVGASYVMQSRLPPTTSLTLADSIQMTAFASTLLAIVISVVVEAMMPVARAGEGDGDGGEIPKDPARIERPLLLGRAALWLFAAIVLFDLAFLWRAVHS